MNRRRWKIAGREMQCRVCGFHIETGALHVSEVCFYCTLGWYDQWHKIKGRVCREWKHLYQKELTRLITAMRKK